MNTPASTVQSDALDATGTQTGFVPTIEDFRRYWMHRSFSNAPEKIEHEVGFNQWLASIQPNGSLEQFAVDVGEIIERFQSRSIKLGASCETQFERELFTALCALVQEVRQ